MPLGTLGKEKKRVASGAAMEVRSREPMKRLGRFDRPKEIAPSSRRGSTTK